MHEHYIISMHVYIALVPIQVYVSQESAWSLKGRESILQLLKYSLDLYVIQSIFLWIFRSQKGSMGAPEFSHNYTIDYLIHM